jgi:Fibronectin type III-like domain
MIRGRSTILATLIFLAAARALDAQAPAQYLDPSQPIESRITDLISRMTLEEKAAELNHLSSIAVEVQNIGSRAGDEVVQLYVHEQMPAVKRPIKELRGFQRIGLQPKEKRRVTFTLPASDLAYYDEVAKRFVTKPGTFDVMIGGSSEDIGLKDRVVVKD